MQCRTLATCPWSDLGDSFDVKSGLVILVNSGVNKGAGGERSSVVVLKAVPHAGTARFL